jgi:hypothetical protein
VLARRVVTAGSAVLTVVSLILLLVWDAAPRLFPADAHLVLGATPLALIAATYLVHQLLLARVPPGRLVRAVLLAAAFLCWAANQAMGDAPLATLMNDLAIALFVVDVLLTMVA